MSTATAEPPLVPLRLSSREQWVLHHVLSNRIDRPRRAPGRAPPPAPEIHQALRKIESGTTFYTVPELRRTREALTAYLRNGTVAAGERREVGHLLERIDDALARRRPLRSR